MDADAITALLASLLVSIVAGLVSGGVGGAIASYYLRRRGDVDCDITGWHKSAELGEEDWYSFTAKFFNHKEVSTALWNLCVVFYDRGGKELDSFALRTAILTKEGLRELDLPPGVTVKQQLFINGEPARMHPLAENASVAAALERVFTGGDPFQQKIERKTPSPTTTPDT